MELYAEGASRLTLGIPLSIASRIFGRDSLCPVSARSLGFFRRGIEPSTPTPRFAG